MNLSNRRFLYSKYPSHCITPDLTGKIFSPVTVFEKSWEKEHTDTYISTYFHYKTLKSIYSVKSNVNGLILIQIMFLMSYAWAHNQMKIKFKWNLWKHNSQTQILHIDITYEEGSYLCIFYLLIQRKVFFVRKHFSEIEFSYKMSKLWCKNEIMNI